MSQFFAEVAHNRINLEKYGENFDHIFKKHKCDCHKYEEASCDLCKMEPKRMATSEELGLLKGKDNV